LKGRVCSHAPLYCYPRTTPTATLLSWEKASPCSSPDVGSTWILRIPADIRQFHTIVRRIQALQPEVHHSLTGHHERIQLSTLMAARMVLPARRGKVCEVVRLPVALRDVFDLRVAIKKEASCSSRALVTSRVVTAFHAGWSQTPCLRPSPPIPITACLLPRRPGTGFLGFWLLEQDSNL
jgi:hypothetical protein